MTRLWLADTAYAVIRDEARQQRFIETGGPLFGYSDSDTGDSVITIAAGPGAAARRRPRSFIGDRAATQSRINELYVASHGTISYLGEWHTHPGGTATPSRRDVAALKAIAADPATDLPAPIAIILPTVILRRRVRAGEPKAYQLLGRLHVKGIDISITALSPETSSETQETT